MAKGSKKYLAALEKVDRDKFYDAAEGIELIKEIDYANFDASVEVAYKLGVDPKQADQQLRGATVLPHGSGKTQTVVVFAKGDAAKAAEDAGADYVGDTGLVERVQGGWLDFDIVVAAPDMMAEVGKLGRILGPKGLMPNPKTGTVTPDVAKAVKDIKAGQVTYRLDRQSNVHVTIGKVSFTPDELQDNLAAIHDIILKNRPASISRLAYLKNVTIASTFGPGVKLDPSTIIK